MFRIIITITFILVAFSANATYKFIPNGNSQNIKLPESPITPYPFNHIDESAIGYDTIPAWINASFEGFGEFNGHKTIKMRFPNSISAANVTFENPKKIKTIRARIISIGSGDSNIEMDVFVTNASQNRVYNTNGSKHNMGFIPDDGNWKTATFNTVNESNKFYFGSPSTTPVTFEIYVVEE